MEKANSIFKVPPDVFGVISKTESKLINQPLCTRPVKMDSPIWFSLLCFRKTGICNRLAKVFVAHQENESLYPWVNFAPIFYMNQFKLKSGPQKLAKIWNLKLNCFHFFQQTIYSKLKSWLHFHAICKLFFTNKIMNLL